MNAPTGQIEALLHIVASACAVACRPLTFVEIMSRTNMPTAQMAEALKTEWFKACWLQGGVHYEPSIQAKDYIVRMFYAQQTSGFEVDVDETTVPLRRQRRIDAPVAQDCIRPVRMIQPV